MNNEAQKYIQKIPMPNIYQIKWSAIHQINPQPENNQSAFL